MTGAWPKTVPQCVLVVDDERQVCEIVAEALLHMGHKVKTAGDGLEAVEKLKDRDCNIVITDMDMPRMDGMELIKYIAEEREDVDIIAITGHTMKYKYTDVVAAGAADFITKPFTLNELEAKLSRLIRERYLRRELERLAVRDPLTGLYNRRSFPEIIRKEVARAQRYKQTLYLFFLDIDKFKYYNDNFGHQAGDDLLVALSGVLCSSVREDVDSVFRYGGDEFTILLPYLPGAFEAVLVADRIRENYNQLGFAPTSLSIGVAKLILREENPDSDIEDLIRRADQSLYHAKNVLGRDRVHLDEESHD